MDESKDALENSNENTADEENKSAISADLIRGHINTIILRTLYERDKYGYEIIEEIEKKSHGQYSLKQPTLYSALKRLESQGYINAYWKTDEVSLGGRRKYYTLTETGREITEKNQAEWEYSRTVIDNLISDRSFDFNQPPPTAVDFKILKKSTSRVPVINGDDDYEVAENNSATEEKLPEVEVKPEAVTLSEQIVIYENATPTVIRETQQPSSLPVPQTEETEVAATETASTEEQRRIAHENYLKLISEPAEIKQEPDVVPVADNIDTDKLIYNNKPETERDYRNLINNLFDKTVKRSQRPADVIDDRAKPYFTTASSTVKIDDVTVKADNDGLKVNSSDYVVSSHKKNYNRGGTLFKSSLIVSVILLLEFALSLIFKDDLGVSLAYPFLIFAIAAAQFLIFGVLYYADIGKSSRRPTSNLYLTASIVITVILVLIIFIVSIIIGINFTSAGDIFAKLIIPCFIAFNIPVFAVCFYMFSKQ